jgi:hypothetical protein
MEATDPPGNPHKESGKRSFLLTVLCLFAFVFFGIISVLFLLALLNTGSIIDMVYRYAPEKTSNGFNVLFYTLGGFVLHAISLTGIIYIWKMRKLGYKLFGISSLIIAGYQLLLTQISPLTTAFYVALIIAFGLFLKKMK